ncbi:tyrosine-type recombinase/integrase [Pseudomonas putida]
MEIRKVRHPSGHELPILLNEHGLPLTIANEWILTRRTLSPNTLLRNLRELSILFSWFFALRIDYMACIAGLRMLTEAEISGSLCERLRLGVKGSQGRLGVITYISGERSAVSPHTFNQRLLTVRQFFSWCFRMVMGALASNDPSLMRLDAIRKQVDSLLEKQKISSPPENKSVRKGLREHEIENLKRCVDFRNPEAYGNDEHVRFRNYLIVMVMLYFGLRPGELLCLQVQDIEIGSISSLRVVRRTPDPIDMRVPRPRVKRNGRDMIVQDLRFLLLIEEYIEVHREAVMEKFGKDHKYLFVSDEGDPLHGNSVSNYFQIIRKKFEGQLPKNLSPKSLRHTYSSQTEHDLAERGTPEDERRQILAYLRGDSSLSAQDVYIYGEIVRQATAVQSSYQSSLMKSFEGYERNA